MSDKINRLSVLSDKELLFICNLDKTTWNEECDDDLLRNRLLKYPGIEKYKGMQSWKDLFLSLMYYIGLLKERFNFDYIGGDFKEQYRILKDSDTNSILILAAEQGELSLVKYALNNGYNIYKDIVLSRAAGNGHLDVVKYLVEKGADIHERGETPLMLAVKNGHLDVVKYLVEKGANIHVYDNYILKLAQERGHTHIMKYLI